MANRLTDGEVQEILDYLHYRFVDDGEEPNWHNIASWLVELEGCRRIVRGMPQLKLRTEWACTRCKQRVYTEPVHDQAFCGCAQAPLARRAKEPVPLAEPSSIPDYWVAANLVLDGE